MMSAFDFISNCYNAKREKKSFAVSDIWAVNRKAFQCCFYPMKATFPQMFADFAQTDCTYYKK